MPFVNEYIPEEDFVIYGLREIDTGISPPEIPGGRVDSKHWTIDRGRNIYLRKFSSSHDLEDCHLVGWTFYWRGELLWFVWEGLEVKGERNGPQWSHIRISKLKIPAHLKPHGDQISKDLGDAFLTYAGGGVFSNATEYSLEIDFKLE